MKTLHFRSLSPNHPAASCSYNVNLIFVELRFVLPSYPINELMQYLRRLGSHLNTSSKISMDYWKCFAGSFTDGTNSNLMSVNLMIFFDNPYAIIGSQYQPQPRNGNVLSELT